MNDMERQVMEMLLRGDHQALEILRQQLAVATVCAREFTGVGFYTDFTLPADIPRLTRPARFTVGDVHADIEGLEHGAGFVLFVGEGALQVLECYIYDDRWPDEAKLNRAYCLHPATPGNTHMIEATERDLPWALRDVVEAPNQG